MNRMRLLSLSWAHPVNPVNPVSQGERPTSSMGKLQFHVSSALAEFERDLIRDRTLAGLVAARARGQPGGRLCGAGR